jgi:hypothetical protein
MGGDLSFRATPFFFLRSGPGQVGTLSTGSGFGARLPEIARRGQLLPAGLEDPHVGEAPGNEELVHHVPGIAKRPIAVDNDELVRHRTLVELYHVGFCMAGRHVEGSADVPNREILGPAGVDDHGCLISHTLPELVQRDAIRGSVGAT